VQNSRSRTPIPGQADELAPEPIREKECVMIEQDIRPNPSILLAGSAAVTAASFTSLDWRPAAASSVLGILMVAGTEVDARTYMLPDLVTGGALITGILAAAVLAPLDPALGAGEATARAVGIAAALWMVRRCYTGLRHREGLGFGDVKLAAGVGAWLPLDAVALCFILAASGGLILIIVARLRGERVQSTTRLPFGAFLCPALWLVFYATRLTS
jgi:leader peptidase (prepilin peptidase)/N-methyltransferase